MNFSLSDEHILLRDSAHDFLRREVDLAPLLTPGASSLQAGYEAMWTRIAALGWPGMIVPQDYGGLGMSVIDLSLIVKECGRFLAPSPLFGTLAGTWAIVAAGTAPQQAHYLGPVAVGQCKLALAVAAQDGDCQTPHGNVKVMTSSEGLRLSGTCHYVVDATTADRIVVAALHEARRRFFVIDRRAPGVEVTLLDWRDITRQVCTVGLSDVPAHLLSGDGHDVWPWIRDRLYLVLAAESAGGLQAVLDDTAAYARERVAFGKPIGAYQAIKHALADLLALTECTSTAVLYAAWALSDDPHAAPLAAAMAQAYASEAYRDATHRSIQVFGAIGFTWEMKNHLYFKRARGNAQLLGSPAHQREQIVRMLEANALAQTAFDNPLAREDKKETAL